MEEKTYSELLDMTDSELADRLDKVERELTLVCLAIKSRYMLVETKEIKSVIGKANYLMGER